MIRYHDLKSECSESVLSQHFSGPLTLHWQSPGGHWHAASAEDFREADRLARSVLSPPTPYSPSLVWISPLTGAPAHGLAIALNAIDLTATARPVRAGYPKRQAFNSN